MTTVALGSNSALKMAAISECYPTCSVLGSNIPSGVPEQPSGIKEIVKGANNRVRGIIKKYPHADIFIGIESGMVMKKLGYWYDTACIVIQHKDGRTNVVWTKSIPIPMAGIERAMKGDGKSKVVRNWSEDKDPHLKLVKKSRKDFIVEAINKVV